MERRKKAKNHTLILGDVLTVGNLTPKTIEDFGQAYGNLILEVFHEARAKTY